MLANVCCIFFINHRLLSPFLILLLFYDINSTARTHVYDVCEMAIPTTQDIVCVTMIPCCHLGLAVSGTLTELFVPGSSGEIY